MVVPVDVPESQGEREHLPPVVCEAEVQRYREAKCDRHSVQDRGQDVLVIVEAEYGTRTEAAYPDGAFHVLYREAAEDQVCSGAEAEGVLPDDRERDGYGQREGEVAFQHKRAGLPALSLAVHIQRRVYRQTRYSRYEAEGHLP